VQQNKDRPALNVTNPEVLDCLAAYLMEKDPGTAHALHSTCRAAAAAVQNAMTSLSVVGRHADLAHTALAFPGLSSLKYTQCAVVVQVCAANWCQTALVSEHVWRANELSVCMSGICANELSVCMSGICANELSVCMSGICSNVLSVCMSGICSNELRGAVCSHCLRWTVVFSCSTPCAA
jgi:hypothetical protein